MAILAGPGIRAGRQRLTSRCGRPLRQAELHYLKFTPPPPLAIDASIPWPDPVLGKPVDHLTGQAAVFGHD
jgi:hypothetical protein